MFCEIEAKLLTGLAMGKQSRIVNQKIKQNSPHPFSIPATGFIWNIFSFPFRLVRAIKSANRLHPPFESLLKMHDSGSTYSTLNNWPTKMAIIDVTKRENHIYGSDFFWLCMTLSLTKHSGPSHAPLTFACEPLAERILWFEKKRRVANLLCCSISLQVLFFFCKPLTIMIAWDWLSCSF